jgi:uncharacterized GH25 family protein
LKKKCVLIWICFGLIFASVSGFAHDLWLIPQKFVIEPGQSLTIFANTGMDFPTSLNAVKPERIKQYILVGQSGIKEFTKLKIQDKSLTTICVIQNPGSYVAAMSLRPREIKLKANEFNEYLLHDGLKNIYELRKKEGILHRDAVEYYSKYPKTIIQVGNQPDNTPCRPLNLVLEIIPGKNPYGLKQRDNLAVAVLFRGKPLTDAELNWSFPGQGEKFAGTTRTDTSGKATVPLTKTGPYVIRMTHMEWVKKPTHEWESYWASLTFNVLPE